uniref:Kinesin motor domain-containing protein n=1 Tax=Trichogramma kaykai TaxID=54128 RepID=A0ABD2XNB7_9HYME
MFSVFLDRVCGVCKLSSRQSSYHYYYRALAPKIILDNVIARCSSGTSSAITDLSSTSDNREIVILFASIRLLLHAARCCCLQFRRLVSRRRTWTCFFHAATTTTDDNGSTATVAMSDSIQVAIKVRPLIRREKDENLPIQWLVSDNTIAPTDPEKKSSSFQFDHIFDSQKNNDDVFQTVVKPIVGASVNGINGTVFAYGQTSSGKTHTMMGTASEPGIIPLAVEHMFDAIAETCHREFLLRVSYLEIYNEKVNDLLDTSATDLKLREDSNGYVQVLNSKEEIVSSPDNILALMKKGDKNRSIGQTDMNERSSRSHTIFRITVESRDESSDSDGAIQVSQLNLVDLAGSERARQTNATGERFKEGTHINMSLSTLGLVIKQLSESSEPGSKYVNFRDSKLTRLLQASLGGNAMTAIICAVTPAAYEETQCTLGFAYRAKSVKNKPQVNEVLSDAALLKRYKKQLAKLNEELEKLKNDNKVQVVLEMESKLQEKEHKLQETDRQNQMLEERIQLLKNSIISAGSSIKEENPSLIPRAKRRRTWAGDRAATSRFSLLPRSCNLPTIKETPHSPDSKSNDRERKKNLQKRKSIIQTINLNDESFETAFTDFELELIKVAKEREEEYDSAMDTTMDKYHHRISSRSEPCVKFQDDVEIHQLSSISEWSDASTIDPRSTPGKRKRQIIIESPGTPKSVLRERLDYLTEEYRALREFTTLEKQILSDDRTDGSSQSETIFLKNQVDGLIKRLEQKNNYQTELEEQLMLCLTCIKGLSTKIPDILELWKPNIFNEEGGEIDTFAELKKLERILEDLENKASHGEPKLTALEKKLTDDYNECAEELKQVQVQKELLITENLELKQDLIKESDKQKKNEGLMQNLRVDTDCLMAKLIEKNNELSKLKERVVELEKSNSEMVQTISLNKLEESFTLVDTSDIKNESTGKMVSETENSDESPLKREISELSQIIEEKNSSIEEYQRTEANMNLKIQELQNCLEKLQNSTQNETNKMENLSKIIEDQAVEINQYKKIEEDMKKEMEELQKTLLIYKEKDLEISNLQNIIKEKSEEISKYLQFEEETKKEIEYLKQCINNSSQAKQVSEEYQINSNLSSNYQIENIDISELQALIQTKSFEIEKYQTSEMELKLEIEQMKKALENLKNTEINTSSNSQTEYLSLNFDKLKNVQECELKIAELLQVINDKTNEIETFTETEKHLRNEIETFTDREKYLRNEIERLENCLTEFNEKLCDATKQNTVSSDKDDECIAHLQKMQEQALEIEQYKQTVTEMQEELQSLQVTLATMANTESIKEKESTITELSEILKEKESEIDYLKRLANDEKMKNENLQQLIKSDDESLTESVSKLVDAEEISRLSSILDEKLLSLSQYKKSEEELRNQMELLRKEKSDIHESEKMAMELTASEKLKIYEEEIEILKKQSDLNEELKSKVDLLTNDIETKLKTIEDLNSLNAKLQLDLDSKVNEMTEKNQLLVNDIEMKLQTIEDLNSLNAKLQLDLDSKVNEMTEIKHTLETKIKELEQKQNIVMTEKNELLEKINNLQSNDISKLKDLETELADLNIIVDCLRLENDNLKKRCSDFEKMSSKINSSLVTNEKPKTTETPLELITDSVIESSPKSIEQHVAADNEVQECSTNVNDLVEVDNNTKKPQVEMMTDPQNVPAKTNVIDTPQLSTKKLELESSSIFANQTYFDNMSMMTDDCTGYIGTEITETIDMTVFSKILPVNQGSEKVQKPSDDNQNVSKLEDVNTIDKDRKMEDSSPINDISKITDLNRTEDVQSPSLHTSLMSNESLTLEELERIRVALENDNIKLRSDLQRRIQELEEVQKVVTDFKTMLGNLEQTVNVLTDENMDLSKKLSKERESSSQVVSNFQLEIDTLTSRLSEISEEKTQLIDEINIVNEQLENLRGTSPIVTDEDTKKKMDEYQTKIREMESENIDLSTKVMDLIEEMDRIKESKVQAYDHECIYKNKLDEVNEKIQCTEKENIELSSDLTLQIEECDKLKETVDVLRQQLKAYTEKQKESSENVELLECLKQENERLTNEVIELRAKATQLNRENTNLSTHIALENSEELNESTINDRRKSASFVMDTSVSSESGFNTSSVKFRIKELENQVDSLTIRNKKLSELKLTNCSQCVHLKEINESRRLMKLEIETLNKKLLDVQKKYEKRCEESESLITNAHEGVNTSLKNLSMLEITLNESCYEGLNVTVMEEKVHQMSNVLEEMQENNARLSNQCQEKCLELEKLQAENISPNSPTSVEKKRSKSNSRKSSARIQTLLKDVERMSSEFQELKRHNDKVGVTLDKFRAEKNDVLREIETLKEANNELKNQYDKAQTTVQCYEDKIKLLEEELESLYKKAEITNATEVEIQSQKLEIEVQCESLLKEKKDLLSRIEEAEDNFKKELESCNSRIGDFEKENNNLKNEILKLEDIVQNLRGNNQSIIEDKLQEEVDEAKSRMIKEIKSMSNLSEDEVKSLSKQSVTDIFVNFVTTLLAKEQEMVKQIQQNSERKQRKLEEERKQSSDAEKRANAWAKTLETDLEKLQGDCSKLEQKNARLMQDIQKLEECLKEAHHENQQLLGNIENFEQEIISLQKELDQKVKSEIDRDSAISAAQEKERLCRNKDEEWEARLRMERDEHLREVEELQSELNSCKSNNDDLKNTIEGLDLEIEHLKSTISCKTSECSSSLQQIEIMEQEILRLEETIQQLKDESAEKNKNIEEITRLLKIKCDMLTEYKTRAETWQPEYENMQAQLAERKMVIEKYKEEINNLKLENKKQLDILQDKLSSEEIKSSGLNKQLTDIKNKNIALSTTIEEFKDRCSELERENSSLQRKVRNSTSKVRVENEMQDLQDENRSLKNHLEGSYNRIKELQESKSQVQRELSEAQGKVEILEHELNANKIALESLRDKYNNDNLQKLRDHYEELLREKNNIVLEVEEKKMIIASKDQKLVEYSIEIETLKKQIQYLSKDKLVLEDKINELFKESEKLQNQIMSCGKDKDLAFKQVTEEKIKMQQDMENLMTKNKELDDEMEELVLHIKQQENEIADLQDRLITGAMGTANLEKLRTFEEENEKLKIDLRVAEVNTGKLQNEIIRLGADNKFLSSRIEDMNIKIADLMESKTGSRNSSKSSSPTTQKSRRRSRRSNVFNQHRNIEEVDNRDVTDNESPSSTPTPPPSFSSYQGCQACNDLKNRIREMSLDLVSRNNKITMLEVQLQAESFPYQVKCNELQEELLNLKTENSSFKLEIQKWQRALMKDSSRECKICRQKSLSKRDAGIQVNEESKVSLTGMSSGIVQDHLRLEKMEKERNWMKELCRSRARRIRELEQKLTEFENVKSS